MTDDSSSSTSDTESDDSPSQIDELKNLSRSESKKLKAVFRRFFGTLCCVIKYQDDIAAKFQLNCLISKSVISKLLAMPFSQQDKTIKLISAIEKRIKSNPSNLYTFIEQLILSSHDDMVETGHHMWRETGKRWVDAIYTMHKHITSLPSLSGAVCPVRTAAILGSQLPPSSVTGKIKPDCFFVCMHIHLVFITGNVCGTQAIVSHRTETHNIPSLPVPTVAGSAMPLVAGKGVLLEYKRYLQSCYNARDLAVADKYLPTLKTHYINLAIVSSGCENIDQFTKATLHGGVDEILRTKSPILFHDLLTPANGKPVRFVLVEGPPGIGKSCFAWEVCRKCDEIPILKEYDAVVLLRLRERWVLNATSLAELFRYPADPEFSKKVAEELNQSQGVNLVLVLDGFDEVSHSFHENSVIKHILNRVLLPECTIILTTRPSARAVLKVDFQPLLDKHLEIIGFPEEERVHYITEVFSKQSELQVNFLKYMFNVPHIKAMMYIPLNCAIIAKVYSESQQNPRLLAIPRTRTQLYQALVHSFLVRYMRGNESDIKLSPTLPEGLPEQEMGMFRTLAKFAFDSYHKDKFKKVTFFEQDMPGELEHFGFMDESTEMYAGKGIERTFSFLHLSLQEYLAAWHMANSYSIHFQVAYHQLALNERTYHSLDSEEASLIAKLEPIASTLLQPAMFLAGITGWRCQSGLQNPWEQYLSRYGDELLCSLYEAQNPSILRTASLCSIFIGFGSQTPYDCYAASYCLSHCSCKVGLVIYMSLYKTSLIETFFQGVYDHCKATLTQVKSLKLDVWEENALALSWLVDVCSKFLTEVTDLEIELTKNTGSLNCLLQLFLRLKSFYVKINKFHYEKEEEFTFWGDSFDALPSLRYVEKMIVSANNIILCSPPPSHPICMALENSITELELDIQLQSSLFDVRSPTASFINDLLKSILRSKQIKVLALPNISRENMANVRAIISQCPSLVKLRLIKSRLGYDGIIYICSALKNNTSLQGITIRDIVEEPPSVPMSDIYSMQTQDIPNKATYTDFILELNETLQYNSTLNCVDINIAQLKQNLMQCNPGFKPLQFNGGRIRNGPGMCPFHSLRRSYSSSDLTQPKTTVFVFHSFNWERYVVGQYIKLNGGPTSGVRKAYLNLVLYSRWGEVWQEVREKLGIKPCPYPSFTAPDTDILPSLSHLDPRLKKCNPLLERNYFNWSRKELESALLKVYVPVKHARIMKPTTHSLFSVFLKRKHTSLQQPKLLHQLL